MRIVSWIMIHVYVQRNGNQLHLEGAGVFSSWVYSDPYQERFAEQAHFELCGNRSK